MNKPRKAFGTHYLQRVHIDAFGAFFQRNIGPFSEGLNLVYGANEAGKTTASTFIGGVLFGWPDARGSRNAYRPAGAHRAGSLTFEAREGLAASVIECRRERNAGGIMPDPNPAVLADIDEATYRTIFSLNSDELLDLGRGTDITAHLLTAGAGTAVSPAHALAEIQGRINNCLSNSAQYPNAIPRIEGEREGVREALEAAAEEAQVFKKEAREYEELAPRLEAMKLQLAEKNEQLEHLAAQSTLIEGLLEERERLEAEHAKVLAQEAKLSQQPESRAEAFPVGIDPTRARALREEIEDLLVRQSQLESDVQHAEDNYAQAKAHFAALAQSGAHLRQQQAEAQKRRFASVAGIALPAIFALAAFLMFMLRRDSNDLAPLVAAIVFALAAVLCAFLVPTLLMRGGGQRSAEEQSLENATNDLSKAEQQMSAAAEKQDSFAAQVAQSLEAAGLALADGDLRYARALLDDMREAQSAQQVFEEQRNNVRATRASLDANRTRNAQLLHEAYASLGYEEQVSLGHIQARVQQESARRQELSNEVTELSQRMGQLQKDLERAEHLQDFDRLKLEDAQLTTRLKDTKKELAQLLVVRQLLEQSIAAWEDKSQPEVYKKAGELMALMTGGAWVEVRMGAQEHIEVVDAFGQSREPQFLSLGTCQQLYLALRIALLMTAENVGRSIPILADDILVNFDARRRVGAVSALQELSKVRQVIVFTCHEEVKQLMLSTCEELNVVEL